MHRLSFLYSEMVCLGEIVYVLGKKSTWQCLLGLHSHVHITR